MTTPEPDKHPLAEVLEFRPHLPPRRVVGVARLLQAAQGGVPWPIPPPNDDDGPSAA